VFCQRGVFSYDSQEGKRKAATVFMKTITKLLCDGQAVRVFSEVGTGFGCYLDEYHVQRLLLTL